MNKVVALVLGVTAWAAVAALAVIMVEFVADDNQILAFFPILAGVVVAWAIGEAVTDRVFEPGEEGVSS